MIIWRGEHGGSFETGEFTTARTLQGHDLVLATTATCWFLGPLRDRLRQPVILTSAKRSRAHNDRLVADPNVAASSTSLHVWEDRRGWAVDFEVVTVDAMAVWNIVRGENIGCFDRLCAYPLTGHCHVDWKPLGQAQRRRFYIADETGNWVHHG